MARNPRGKKPVEASRDVVVTFGRDVTEEDLRRLRAHADVLTVQRAQIDVDQDHVHDGDGGGGGNGGGGGGTDVVPV
jgi:hypothetical protein